MNRKHISVLLVATILSTTFAVASATAACSNRPGTPTDVNVFPLPNSQLQVRWTNTARNDETVWWDVENVDRRRCCAGTACWNRPGGQGLRLASFQRVLSEAKHQSLLPCQGANRAEDGRLHLGRVVEPGLRDSHFRGSTRIRRERRRGHVHFGFRVAQRDPERPRLCHTADQNAGANR